MFSSFFSAAAPPPSTDPTLFPVSSRYPTASLNGKLEAKDLNWTCAGGFATETQTFYIVTEDNVTVMCQVIHASLGVWYPTIQFTCKIYDAKTKDTVWRSMNCPSFVSPPPGLDKRSCKADEFSVTYAASPDSGHPESYTIDAQVTEDLKLHLVYSRPAGVPGFKLGADHKGGFTYYGADVANPEGHVVHRFWPRTETTGYYIKDGGEKVPVVGTGMVVRAIQGMRVNLTATRWNFANFQSNSHGGVSALQMEFTTQEPHGRKGPGSGGVTVNVGSLVVGGKLISISAETTWPDEPQPESPEVMSRATELASVPDADTGYEAPTQMLFQWKAPSVVPEATGNVEGTLHVDFGTYDKPKGLIEKVDVLAEIPYVLKMAVNYVAGTKPYVYQWTNDAKLLLKGPDAVYSGLAAGLEIEGNLYVEASFIC